MSDAAKIVYFNGYDSLINRNSFNVKKKEYVEVPADGKFTENIKKTPQTVLRKLFVVIGKKYAEQKGGYTRIYHLPPRRGDASEMALIQLV